MDGCIQAGTFSLADSRTNPCKVITLTARSLLKLLTTIRSPRSFRTAKDSAQEKSTQGGMRTCQSSGY